MRFTIEEYSKQFKMSKELINSKLRSKKLNYVIEDGETFIVISQSSMDEEKIEEIQQQKREQEKQINIATQKMTVGTILSLYKRENDHLKQKIRKLENKIDSLIADKENMLREERDKIEQVYSTKDEHLKNILELINKQLMLEQKAATVHEVTLSNLEEMQQEKENLSHIDLKSYLKTLDLQSYQRKIIKKRFFDALDHDVRIIQQNGKLYLDFAKYDYSDLLKL
jgi:preprotein translocase subunit SecD